MKKLLIPLLLLFLLSDTVAYAQTNPITVPTRLRPVSFHGVIKWVFPSKGLIILDQRTSTKERMDITLNTAIATIGRNGVQMTALSSLRPGDRIFGYVQRKIDQTQVSKWNALTIFRTNLQNLPPELANELQPKRFRSVVNITDVNANTLFLATPGPQQRLLITPNTLILAVTRSGLERRSLSELRSGDKVFGFIQRNIEDASTASFLFRGLVIVKVE